MKYTFDKDKFEKLAKSNRKRLTDWIKSDPNMDPLKTGTDQDSFFTKKRDSIVLNMVPRDPEDVTLTPYGKNYWKDKDNKRKDTDRLKLTDPITNFEQDLMSRTYEYGLKVYGTPIFKYEDAWDGDHLEAVDFWRSYAKIGREVTPHTYRRRLNTLSKYFKENSVWNPDTKILTKAVEMVSEELGPQIAHNTELKVVRQAFQEHNSNVGYRTYSKERTMYKGEMFRDIALDDAKKLAYSELKQLPSILLGRNQRGGYDIKFSSSGPKLIGIKDSKSRVVFGSSRSGVYITSQVTIPMVNSLKHNSNLFLGYNDSTIWGKKLYEAGLLAKRLNKVFKNDDFKLFDTTVPFKLIMLAREILLNQVKTAEGGVILRKSFDAFITKGIYFADSKGKLMFRFKMSAIPSGDGLTNLVGGLISAILVTYAKLKHIPDFSKTVQEFKVRNLPWMLVMGDDNCSVQNTAADSVAIAAIIKSDFGMDIHPEKGELGTYFLKTRVMPDGKLVMPASNAWSKMWFIERNKGLGPWAWTVATWMKWQPASKSKVMPLLMKYIFVQYDKQKMGTFNDGKNITASQFHKLLVQEFKDAQKSLGNKAQSMKEALHTGGPEMDKYFEDDGTVKSVWISEMWNKAHDLIWSSPRKQRKSA